MSDLKVFDRYVQDDGPAALVLRQWLMPVEGADGVVFPPTFAAGDGFPGGYNLDVASDGSNVCLIDSVGSQANRIEPMFAEESYQHLVPQITVNAGEKSISLLDAGHRAGDALVRCSALQADLQNAFKSVLKGDAEPLARLAPTSLVFGVWDSRDTQAKMPRLVASTIRAFNVRRLTRSAQFNPATDYVREQLLEEPSDKTTRDEYSVRGFVHVPATNTHGGVIADGGIRRDATLGLAALRMIHVGKDKEKTRKLRRYILGLALTAFTRNPSGYLRQGCLLVLDPDRAKDNELTEVMSDGRRLPCAIAHKSALDYAAAVANDWGVAAPRTVDFDKKRAKDDVAGDGKKAKTKKSKEKTAEPSNE